MTCADFRSLLTPWVDGELSPRETAEIELHLNACGGCRHTASRERRFVDWFKRSASREPTPYALRTRLLALARGKHEAVPIPRFAFFSSLRPALGTVGTGAAILASVFALWAFNLQRLNRVEWCQAFIDDHQEGLVAGVSLQHSTSSPKQLAAWFTRKLNQAIAVPEVSDARLLGGRQCVLKGHRVGLAVYEMENQQISLFLTSQQQLRPPGWTLSSGRYHTASENGFSLAAWEGAGILQVLVADLPVDQLLKVADRFRQAPN